MKRIHCSLYFAKENHLMHVSSFACIATAQTSNFMTRNYCFWCGKGTKLSDCRSIKKTSILCCHRTFFLSQCQHLLIRKRRYRRNKDIRTHSHWIIITKGTKQNARSIHFVLRLIQSHSIFENILFGSWKSSQLSCDFGWLILVKFDHTTHSHTISYHNAIKISLLMCVLWLSFIRF